MGQGDTVQRRQLVAPLKEREETRATKKNSQDENLFCHPVFLCTVPTIPSVVTMTTNCFYLFIHQFVCYLEIQVLLAV